MPGRKLLTDADWIPTHFGAFDPEMIRRRAVLAETINRFDNGKLVRAVLAETINRFDNGKLVPHYHKLAQQNLTNWSAATKSVSYTHLTLPTTPYV